jgi:TctA family transporter
MASASLSVARNSSRITAQITVIVIALLIPLGIVMTLVFDNPWWMLVTLLAVCFFVTVLR